MLVRGAPDVMAAKLASRFDIKAADAKRIFGYGNRLDSRLGKLKDAIQRGTHPGCREPGFSAAAAVEAVLNSLVEEYVARLVVIDGLQGVSDETREALRAIVRRQNQPEKPFVDARRAQRIAAKVDGTALLAALDAPNATDEARFEAIRKYADAFHDAAVEEFREELRDGQLGTDELLPVVALVRAFAIGATPGLGAALERLSADPFVLRANAHFARGENTQHPIRATVASTLF